MKRVTATLFIVFIALVSCAATPEYQVDRKIVFEEWRAVLKYTEVPKEYKWKPPNKIVTGAPAEMYLDNQEMLGITRFIKDVGPHGVHWKEIIFIHKAAWFDEKVLRKVLRHEFLHVVRWRLCNMAGHVDYCRTDASSAEAEAWCDEHEDLDKG